MVMAVSISEDILGHHTHHQSTYRTGSHSLAVAHPSSLLNNHRLLNHWRWFVVVHYDLLGRLIRWSCRLHGNHGHRVLLPRLLDWRSSLGWQNSLGSGSLGRN